MSNAFVVGQRLGERSATIASNIQSKSVEEVLDVCLLLRLKEINLALIAEAGVSRKGYPGALGANPSLLVSTTAVRPATVALGGVVPVLFDIEKSGHACAISTLD
jgi:hypothetical protein